MQETGLRNSSCGADKFGFKDLGSVHWNLAAPALYEHAIAAREASVVDGEDQAVTGHPYYDTVSIKAVDDRTIEETDKKDGKTVS